MSQDRAKPGKHQDPNTQAPAFAQEATAGQARKIPTEQNEKRMKTKILISTRSERGHSCPLRSAHSKRRTGMSALLSALLMAFLAFNLQPSAFSQVGLATRWGVVTNQIGTLSLTNWPRVPASWSNLTNNDSPRFRYRGL